MNEEYCWDCDIEIGPLANGYCPKCGKDLVAKPEYHYFILMKTRATLDYLYGYAQVVETHGPVRIVGITLKPEGNPQYYAEYQLNRLSSGMDSASRGIFTTLDGARKEVEDVLQFYK